MNRTEVAQLLTLASAFDKRKVDDPTVLAWHAVLKNFDYGLAEQAVIEHQAGALRREYLTVGHVVDAVRAASRQNPEQIEVDVRSAKARRWIPQDWPRRQPLPADMAARLAEARTGARVAAEAFGELEAGVPAVELPRLRDLNEAVA